MSSKLFVNLTCIKTLNLKSSHFYLWMAKWRDLAVVSYCLFQIYTEKGKWYFVHTMDRSYIPKHVFQANFWSNILVFHANFRSSIVYKLRTQLKTFKACQFSTKHKIMLYYRIKCRRNKKKGDHNNLKIKNSS